MINKAIDKFLHILEIAHNMSFVTVDMNVVAIRELQVMLNSLDDSEKQKAKKALYETLNMLKNRDYIYDFKQLEDGFEIKPRNKLYWNEELLKIKI